MAKRYGSPPDPGARTPRRVRLPGFTGEDDIGLGDAIGRATHAVGITPCGGCRKRARALNRRVVVSGRRRHGR
ncbi:hypothetical protein SAMN05216499_11697 [Actinacidiphila paucisporea]|uniref:Uncharacterized protein n=1 Tax=Actinacidiphila paucisporea TaxID=310782 RepID=A0A1M7MM31_9ACTN|nr:hypothetical protein SAMN05216499_11697 [Actinacidiphila paucisporea]